MLIEAPSTRWLRLLAGPVLLLESACGGGTAVVLEAFRRDGGTGTQSAPTLSNVEAVELRTSPAHLRLKLTDQASRPADLDLTFSVAGEPFTPVLLVAGQTVEGLKSSPEGVDHDLQWDFEKQLGGSRFWPDLKLVVEVRGSGDRETLEPDGLGNDRPEIMAVALEDPESGEFQGLIDLSVQVCDSSGDLVDIEVLWKVVGSNDSLQPIRPAGTPFREPTPCFAARGVPTTGSDPHTVVWDSEHDLRGKESNVEVQVRVFDGVEGSAPLVLSTFTIDNNDAPIATLLNDLVIQNPDERRGIPLAFEIIDTESDAVRMAVQWRRPGESFPTLPAVPADLEELMGSPGQRKLHQICSERAVTFDGWMVNSQIGDEGWLLLPDLCGIAAVAIDRGLVGQQLEFLRPAHPQRTKYASNTLIRPVGALVLDGHAALVLEAMGAGWRLAERELRQGRLLPDTALLGGPGQPTAVALSPDASCVFVASLVAGNAVVERFDRRTGEIRGRLSVPSREQEGVRALVAVSPASVWATLDSMLARISFAGSLPTLSPVVGAGDLQLSRPWGVAVDPEDPATVYVAESGRDRILRVDERTRAVAVLEVSVAANDRARLGPVALPAPSCLTFGPDSSSLWVLTHPGGAPGGPSNFTASGLASLRSFSLRAVQPVGSSRPVPPSANPRSAVVRELGGWSGAVRSLTAASDHSVVLCLPEQSQLLVGGGIRSRHTISDVRLPVLKLAGGAIVRLDPPLEEVLEGGLRWRLPSFLRQARSSPQGAQNRFVWDSRDLPGGGDVFLRIVPWDTDRGLSSEGLASKHLRVPVDSKPVALDLTLLDPQASPKFLAAGDFDADGYGDVAVADDGAFSVRILFGPLEGSDPGLELVLPGTDPVLEILCKDLNRDGLHEILVGTNSAILLFAQPLPRHFAERPSLQLQNATAMSVADVDQDGFLDILVGCGSDQRVAIFWQSQQGVHRRSPSSLLPQGRPESILAADFDNDGHLDVASAGAQHVSIFPGPDFGARRDLSVGSFSTPTRLFAADLDLDGRTDLSLLVDREEFLLVYLQRADGSYPAQADQRLVSPGGNVVDGAQVDLDGDGLLDLIVSDSMRQEVVAFFQERPGRFATSPGLLLPMTGQGPRQLGFADLNGDRVQDLVVAAFTSGQVVQHLGVPTSALPDLPHDRLGGVQLRDGVVRHIDLDGDGLLDLVSAEPAGRIVIHSQLSAQTFSAFPEVLELGNPQDVVGADLNADGLMDLAVADGAADRVVLLFRDDEGNYSSTQVLGVPTVTILTMSILAQDLNHDGLLDLATANMFSNTFEGSVAVYYQMPAGCFSSQPDDLVFSESFALPVDLASGDFNGDGRVDLAVAHNSGREVEVLLGHSAGFSQSSAFKLQYPFSAPVASVAAEDLNNDGRKDLIVTTTQGSASEGALFVFHQGRRGLFDSDPDVVLGEFPDNPMFRESTAVDVNRDGLLDLVTGFWVEEEPNLSRLAVFYQRSLGRFAEQADLEISELLARSIVAADLDRDGEVDFAAPLSPAADRIGLFWAGR